MTRVAKLGLSLLLAFCVFAFASGQARADTTTGNCSPIVKDVGGNVVINCSNKALDFLVDQINEKNADLKAKTAEVQSWVDRYKTLQQSLGSSQGYAQLRAEALAAFNHNDLVSAGSKLDIVIDDEERNQVAQIAQDHFDRAEMLVFQNAPDKAQPHYRRAFELKPDNPRFATAYARSQCDRNKTEKAREILQESVDQLRVLAVEDEVAYSGDLVCALVNLAGIYNRLGSYKDSKKAADEALDVARRLLMKYSDRDAKIHLADALTVVGAANVKMGNRDEGSQQLSDAESYYSGVKLNNANRPYVHEMLARAAREQGNEPLEGKELLRALQLEEDLVKQIPIFFRPRLSEYFRMTITYLQRTRNIGSTRIVHEEYTNFINDSGVDSFTSTFLQSSADEVWTTTNCLEADTCDLSTVDKSIEALSAVSSQLSADESQELSLAILDRGVIALRQKDYHGAYSYMSQSLLIAPGFRADQRRMAQGMFGAVLFFTSDFGTAARSFVGPGNVLSDEERAVWTYLIATTDKGSAGKLAVLDDELSDDPLLATISRLTAGKTQDLDQAQIGVVAARSRAEWRCRDLLVLRHYNKTVADVIAQSINCSGTIDYDPYYWIIVAEKSLP
jgi:tetratricopeptide (TPR) repeat protein